jgi:peptide/nickel transport system substrate-binding protein
MKNRVILVGLSILLLGALLIPAAAQDEGGPGEGGIIVEDNFGGDPSTFNPILSADTVSSDSWAFLYPSIFTLNPETAVSEPGQRDAMAESWEFDESGTVLTLNLRDDITWNDGTPITAADYLWSAEAVRSGETSSPRTYVFETLADGTAAGGKVVSVEAPDDYTLVVTFSERDCAAFEDVNDITPVPSHIFEALYGDNYAAMDEDPRRIPEVTFGPFKDLEFSPDERVSLIADQSYPDTILGYVSPAEWIYRRVADTTVAFEQFLAGDITYTSVAPERQNEIRDNPDFQTFEFSQNGFTYMGYNLADPTNPQDGLDAEGNVIDQGNHPIFGDVRVRQAIAHAVDVDAMIEGILDGNGTRVNTHAIPTSWTFDPDLEPYAFDPELALEILAEAGWVDDDMDPSTPLICDGCLYAEPGSPLEFDLVTNAGNLARERIGQTIQSQLGEIGITVNFSAIDFGVLVQNIQGQEGDAFIIGWSLGLPVDPDVTSFYTAESDQVGAGFGFTSYNNPELNELLVQGRTVPGCAIEDRLPIYQQVNQILYDDQPYLYLYAGNVMYAAQGDVQNWNPFPNFHTWNIDAWSAE